MKEAELGLTKLSLEEKMKERDFNRWLKTPGTISSIFKQGVEQGYTDPDQADIALKLFGETGVDVANMVATPESLMQLKMKLLDVSKPIKVGSGLWDPVKEEWDVAPATKDKDKYVTVSPGGLYNVDTEKWVRSPDVKDSARYKTVSPGGLYDTQEGTWVRQPDKKDAKNQTPQQLLTAKFASGAIDWPTYLDQLKAVNAVSKPEMTKSQALKRISNIEKARAELGQADKVTALIAVVSPDLVEGTQLREEDKLKLEEAWGKELEYLATFTGEETEEGAVAPPPEQEEIALPETIKTTSEALDYLMKTYQMDKNSAVSWLRNAMTPQQ
jgi:hypothetical protein